jgi:multimeric flavodoxin WrbA
MNKILILNGSLSQEDGNSQLIIEQLKDVIKTNQATFTLLSLKTVLKHDHFEEFIKESIESHQALIFVTGTYWDSWGSPLQEYLERTTFLEASKSILGKPASVIVTMHSVGGKSVLSRLQGVLSTQGFLIPPMSGFVYSLANKLSSESESSFSDDFWSPEDLQFIIHNLLESTKANFHFKAWPVDFKDPKRIWIK